MKNIIFESGKQYGASGNLPIACGDKHFWVWAGDPNYPIPEGYPCACGNMLWHIEKCKECGNNILKPQVR